MKKPASGQLTGKSKTRSNTEAKSTFASVLDQTFSRLTTVEEALWQHISDSGSLSNVLTWLSVANERRLVAGHRAKIKEPGE
jgi:hypothetical protein